ncbi:MAG: hypothetical protein QXS85_04220 [Acidilobaceae archaeon]
MSKAKKEKTTQTTKGSGEAATKSKELKLVTVQVITKDRVVKNERQMALLYLINEIGPMHERTVYEIAREVQELGFPLGYTFKRVADSLYCPELKSDLIALTYVGFLETDPVRKKYRVTGQGKEALEATGVPEALSKLVESHREKLKNHASLVDAQVEFQSVRPARRRRESSILSKLSKLGLR